MKFSIPFLSWTGKAALEIEVGDDTEPRWRLRAALQVAVGSGADLGNANLVDANLVDANLVGANLRSIRSDFFDILLRAQPEVPGLLKALRDGRVNGSAYTGECACLCGTIANVRGVDYQTLGFVDSSRPAEGWFLGIREGDKPDTAQLAKITEGWILEFCELTGIKVEPVAPVVVE